MNIEKFKIYLELFTKLCEDKQIDISWRENPMTFRSIQDIGEYLKDKPELNEEEFVDAIFKIIGISKLITTEVEGSIKGTNQEFIDLVNNTFLSNQSFRSDIATQILTNGSYIDELETEVLTKRAKSNPQNILGYSALLNIDYKKSSKDSKNLILELNEDELSKLIEKLKAVREEIKFLSKLE